MKKTIKMIGMACLVGALAFVGSSCKKNNTDNTSSIKLGLPTLEETSVMAKEFILNILTLVIPHCGAETIRLCTII